MPAVHGRNDASGPRRLRGRPLLRALPLVVIALIGLAAFPVSAPAEPVLASGGRDADAVVAGFQTPMFLIPLFRSAERATGVPWQVLAAINEIETDYGRNLAGLARRSRRLDAVHAGDVARLRRGRRR